MTVLRPIEALPAREPLPTECGPVPELRWVKIADLRVDEAYQRAFSAKGIANVHAIAAAFDWRLFAPVVVSPVAGGFYAIVDGQHRTTAALMCGFESVPCLVIQADRQHQARAFEAINGQVTKVTQHARYKARLVAGEPQALGVKRVADRAGVKLLFANVMRAAMKPGETVAFFAIENAIAAHGEAVATIVLHAIVVSAGDLGGHLSSAIINAVTAVLADHRDWQEDARLDDAMRSIDLEETRASCYRSAVARRVAGPTLLEAAITEHLERELGQVRRIAAAPGAQRMAS